MMNAGKEAYFLRERGFMKDFIVKDEESLKRAIVRVRQKERPAEA